MPTSWSRIEVRRRWPTSAEIDAVARDVQERYGRWAAKEIQSKIWAYSRFVYRNVRPKPSRSKSSDGWTFRVESWGRSGPALIVFNPTVNRYGTNYPKYVHLAGRPKSDRLMNEVHDFMQDAIAPKVGEAMALGAQRLLARTITTRTKIGG